MTINQNHIATILGSEPVNLRTENAELRAEVERLKNELIAQSEMVQRDWASPAEKHGMEKEIERLRDLKRTCQYSEDDQCLFARERDEALVKVERCIDALEMLVDLQNGPPLHKYRRSWHEAMAEACRLLKREQAAAYHAAAAAKEKP